MQAKIKKFPRDRTGKSNQLHMQCYPDKNIQNHKIRFKVLRKRASIVYQYLKKSKSKKNELLQSFTKLAYQEDHL